MQVYEFLRARDRDTLCVRFEDLLLYPEETLADACALLGVPYQESMLRGTGNAKMLLDYRQQHLDISKLELIDVPTGCIDRIRDELKLCGYL